MDQINSMSIITSADSYFDPIIFFRRRVVNMTENIIEVSLHSVHISTNIPIEVVGTCLYANSRNTNILS